MDADFPELKHESKVVSEIIFHRNIFTEANKENEGSGAWNSSSFPSIPSEKILRSMLQFVRATRYFVRQ
jgi:hypothetical protein